MSANSGVKVAKSGFSISALAVNAANVLFSISGLCSSTDLTLKFWKSLFVKSGFSMSAASGFPLSNAVAVSPPTIGAHVAGSDSLTCTLIDGGWTDEEVTNTVLTAPDRAGIVTQASTTGAGEPVLYGGSGSCVNVARPIVPAGGASPG